MTDTSNDEFRDRPRVPAQPLPPGHDEKPSPEPGATSAEEQEEHDAADDQLEDELEDSFPASDPPSITQPK